MVVKRRKSSAEKDIERALFPMGRVKSSFSTLTLEGGEGSR